MRERKKRREGGKEGGLWGMGWGGACKDEERNREGPGRLKI